MHGLWHHAAPEAGRLLRVLLLRLGRVPAHARGATVLWLGCGIPFLRAQVMVDEKTDQILGAHLVGPNVDEVINLFGLAIRQGLRQTL